MLSGERRSNESYNGSYEKRRWRKSDNKKFPKRVKNYDQKSIHGDEGQSMRAELAVEQTDS